MIHCVGFSGSFDPVTWGHVWVVQEALNWAEKVIVLLGVNPEKKGMFKPEERLVLWQEALREKGIEDRVELVEVRGEFIALKAQDLGCTRMVRGIRSAVDFDYERQINRVNVDEIGGLATVFVMAPVELEALSSSFIKGMVGNRGWVRQVEKWVPRAVLEAMMWKWVESKVPSQARARDWIELLKRGYGNESRVYHSVEHLVDLIEEWEFKKRQNPETKLDEKVMMWSILGHDLVQGVVKDWSDWGVKEDQTAERASVEVLKKAMIEYGEPISENQMKMIESCIMATEHVKVDKKKISEEVAEVRCFHDLDLSVLTKTKEGYERYMDQVRREYEPKYGCVQYEQGRFAVLRQFIQEIEGQEGGWWTSGWYTKQEQDRALKNLKQECETLEKGLGLNLNSKRLSI